MRGLKQKQERLKAIALLADEELLEALCNATEKSGRHIRTEAEWCLKKFFHIGPFASKDKSLKPAKGDAK